MVVGGGKGGIPSVSSATSVIMVSFASLCAVGVANFVGRMYTKDNTSMVSILFK